MNILLLLSIAYNSIALSVIVIFLLIIIKFYYLGEKGIWKTLVAFIFILTSMILDTANSILNLAIYLGLIGPRFLLPTDIPYSMKYIFLWVPQLALYPLAYFLIIQSLREGKVSLGMVNSSYIIILPILKLPVVIVSNFISLVLTVSILHFYLKVTSNINKWVIISICTLSLSHLIQMISCLFLPIILFILAVLIRATSFIILLLGGIRGETVEEEI